MGETASGRSCRAPSACCARPRRRRRARAAVPARGRRPGHPSACASWRPATSCSLVGPLGVGFAPPREGRAPLLVGGGVGIAPLAILAGRARRRRRRCSGSATRRTPPERRCCARRAVATDDGSVGHHGLVTELLAERARADDRRRGLRLRTAGDARGGARALRRARASRPSWRSSPAWRAASAPASAASSRPATGYIRLCLEGPVLDAARARDRCRRRGDGGH